MSIPHGFTGERLYILPQPAIQQALRRPPTDRLLVTDAGYFPHAVGHGRSRPHGTGAVVLIWCVEGAGLLRLAGSTQQIGPGQLALLPVGEPHSYLADATNPWTIWWCHLTGSAAADLARATGIRAEAAVVAPPDPETVALLIAEVVDRAARDETAANLVATAGAAWHLLACLAGAAGNPTGDVRDPVTMVQHHLLAHSAEPVIVAELARRVGLSPSHLAARFRASTGFSILQYLKRLRMARARELLATGDRSVGAIAAAVGYPDAFYFSRQFHEVHGVSPSQFRAALDQERFQAAH